MLNGIGGRTIEEAKERMSYAEARSWQAYMAKRGGLNLGTRLEFGFAMVLAMIVNRSGGNASPNDFIVHREVDDDDGDATLDDVMGILSGARR